LKLRFTAATRKVLGDIAPQVKKFLEDLGRDLTDAMKRSLSLPKHGRVYVRSDARRKRSGRAFRRLERIHRASAPGEAPASDTGALARSIKARVPSAFQLEIETSDIGEMLEFGTETIDERPFIRPAIKHVTEQLRNARATGMIDRAA
jgi:hypothetical protein